MALHVVGAQVLIFDTQTQSGTFKHWLLLWTGSRSLVFYDQLWAAQLILAQFSHVWSMQTSRQLRMDSAGNTGGTESSMAVREARQDLKFRFTWNCSLIILATSVGQIISQTQNQKGIKQALPSNGQSRKITLYWCTRPGVMITE